MESAVSFAVLAFGSLFAVLNPFATVPPFLAMTEGDSYAQRSAMARRACSIACGVLIAFVLGGLAVLTFFGVSVAAFRIAGGLVLIRVAFELLQGGRQRVTPEERAEGTEKDDISITPLGVPLLCGPATITTGILVSSQADGWTQRQVLIGIVVLMYAGIYVMLRTASRHAHLLGETSVKIVSRLMGLILVGVAVQFVVDGLEQTGVFTDEVIVPVESMPSDTTLGAR